MANIIWKFRTILLSFLIQFVLVSGLTDCFKDQNNYECRLGTKVPYSVIANYNDSPIHFPGTYGNIILLMRNLNLL